MLGMLGERGMQGVLERAACTAGAAQRGPCCVALARVRPSCHCCSSPPPALPHPLSNRTDGNFARAEDGLWDTPEAARWILSSLRDAHAPQLADLKTPAGQPLAELVEEGLAAKDAHAVVVAAVGAKEAVAATTALPTLLAVDDYNALYSHTGALLSFWVCQLGWLQPLQAAGRGQRVSSAVAAAGSAAGGPAVQLPTTCTELRTQRAEPSLLRPAGYYESVHNFHRCQLAPEELRLVRGAGGRLLRGGLLRCSVLRCSGPGRRLLGAASQARALSSPLPTAAASPSPPQVRAFRILEHPPPANGVAVAAPTMGQVVSEKLRLPLPRGCRYGVPRYGLPEVAAAGEYYATDVMGGYREHCFGAAVFERGLSGGSVCCPMEHRCRC